MKKALTFVLGTLLITTSFISCKKGDHDPFLSLSSRKARLEGKWTVTHQDITETSINGGTTVQTSAVYDGTKKISTVTTTVGTSASTAIDTTFYTYTLTIKKDGTYSQLVESADLTSLTQVDGTWIFLKKSKLNKLKNKEAILLTTTKTTILSAGATNVVDYTDLNGSTILIDELKGKEMITIVETESHNEDGLSSDKQTIKTTFTQK